MSDLEPREVRAPAVSYEQRLRDRLAGAEGMVLAMGQNGEISEANARLLLAVLKGENGE